MSGQEVPRVRTPIAPEDLVDVLARGHHAALGEAPHEIRLRFGWAQVMFESGRGVAIWNNNLGNITTGSLWTGPYFVLTTRERVKRDPDVWEPRTLRYRAHEDPILAAKDYWLRMTQDFVEALHFIDAGDVHGACETLSGLTYFTGLETIYEGGVTGIEREFEDALWKWP